MKETKEILHELRLLCSPKTNLVIKVGDQIYQIKDVNASHNNITGEDLVILVAEE